MGTSLNELKTGREKLELINQVLARIDSISMALDNTRLDEIVGLKEDCKDIRNECENLKNECLNFKNNISDKQEDILEKYNDICNKFAIIIEKYNDISNQNTKITLRHNDIQLKYDYIQEAYEHFKLTLEGIKNKIDLDLRNELSKFITNNEEEVLSKLALKESEILDNIWRNYDEQWNSLMNSLPHIIADFEVLEEEIKLAIIQTQNAKDEINKQLEYANKIIADKQKELNLSEEEVLALETDDIELYKAVSASKYQELYDDGIRTTFGWARDKLSLDYSSLENDIRKLEGSLEDNKKLINLRKLNKELDFFRENIEANIRQLEDRVNDIFRGGTNFYGSNSFYGETSFSSTTNFSGETSFLYFPKISDFFQKNPVYENELVHKAYVDNLVQTRVSLNSDEIIAGNKSFSQETIFMKNAVCDVEPTQNHHLTNKAYVDNLFVEYIDNKTQYLGEVASVELDFTQGKNFILTASENCSIGVSVFGYVGQSGFISINNAENLTPFKKPFDLRTTAKLTGTEVFIYFIAGANTIKLLRM